MTRKNERNRLTNPRYYDPSIGRFISEDPIGFAGDPSNVFRYVVNAPTMYTDPTGLDPMAWDAALGQLYNYKPTGMEDGIYLYPFPQVVNGIPLSQNHIEIVIHLPSLGLYYAIDGTNREEPDNQVHPKCVWIGPGASHNRACSGTKVDTGQFDVWEAALRVYISFLPSDESNFRI